MAWEKKLYSVECVCVLHKKKIKKLIDKHMRKLFLDDICYSISSNISEVFKTILLNTCYYDERYQNRINEWFWREDIS